GDAGAGVARAPQAREARARRRVSPLGGLVRIRGRADRDRAAAPGPAGKFDPEDLRDVHLAPDRAAVVVAGRAVGPPLECPHVAERAALSAPHVLVERPLERHALAAVARRAAG